MSGFLEAVTSQDFLWTFLIPIACLCAFLGMAYDAIVNLVKDAKRFLDIE